MPSDFSFDLRLQRARDEIEEALNIPRPSAMPQIMPQQAYRPQPVMQPSMQMQANPQMSNFNVPMGGGLSAGAQTGGGMGMPYGMQNASLNYSAPSNAPYMPQQSAANMRTPFQEGGLATSVRSDPVYHERDVDFINTRNQHMREVAGKQAYAKGGGVWTRKEGQNPEGGLNAAGRASLKAQGHDIKPPVSAKQAKKSPKAAARRKSFCARMSGMPGPMKDEKGRPTRKALSLRKWDC